MRRAGHIDELTATFLPSSLTKNHSFALVHLYQPTCVGLRYGSAHINLRRFSRETARQRSPHNGNSLRSFEKFHLRTLRDLPRKLLRNADANPITRVDYSSLSLLFGYERSAGILTCCPSATPFGLALGPTHPWLIVIAKETLGFRRSWFSQDLWLLIPAFSLLCAPQNFTVLLRCTEEALLPLSILRRKIRIVGTSLSPIHFRRAISELVSCYAFFKGWLLLSQPPRCLRNRTSLKFALSEDLGTLDGGLGFFPFDYGA